MFVTCGGINMTKKLLRRKWLNQLKKGDRVTVEYFEHIPPRPHSMVFERLKNKVAYVEKVTDIHIIVEGISYCRKDGYDKYVENMLRMPLSNSYTYE